MSKDARTTGPIEVRPISRHQDREAFREILKLGIHRASPVRLVSAPTPLDAALSSYWEAAVEICECTLRGIQRFTDLPTLTESSIAGVCL
jgi:hypothetical protein